MLAPFSIHEPEEDSPVIVEVPHAGLALDAPALATIVAPARGIAKDADLYVDRLFARASEAGATLLVAHASRWVVDLNRAPDDFDGHTVAGGPAESRPRGVVWRLTSEGLPLLREQLSAAEHERRMRAYWHPYHDALTRLIARKKATFGAAVLLCGHSMPTPRTRGVRSLPPPLPDIVPGSRGRTTADGAWIDLVERVALAHHLTVQHDMPYRGGYSTGHYGTPEDGVHAVQIEIARRLYMDEDALVPLPDGFERVERFARQLVADLVKRARRVYRKRAHAPRDGHP